VTMKTLRTWTSTLVAAAALVVAAYGCSGDDDDQGSEVDGGPATGGTSTDATVLLDAAQGGAAGQGAAEHEETCGTEALEATYRQVNVLLVIDKSGSMTEEPPGWSSQDKWSALQTALDEALTAVQEYMWFGMLLYPYPAESTAAACEQEVVESENWVAMEVGTTSVLTILSTLESVEPSGGTPTSAALAQAYEYFTTGDGAELEGDKVVLLATDGAPNCNDIGCEADKCIVNIDGDCPEDAGNCCEGDPGQCLDNDATVQQIQQLQEQGIPTFVIGIPGSEDYADTLDAMAQAGGVPSTQGGTDYFAVDLEGGVEGLADVLIGITRELITTCELQLESDPPDPGKINVEIDGERIVQESENGWELDKSTDPFTVILKGDTCTRVQNEGVESVTITFGCPTLLPQ
jgi:hypothetical protein